MTEIGALEMGIYASIGLGFLLLLVLGRQALRTFVQSYDAMRASAS